MWLGDIAKLPETEQYYLRSENVAMVLDGPLLESDCGPSSPPIGPAKVSLQRLRLMNWRRISDSMPTSHQVRFVLPNSDI